MKKQRINVFVIVALVLMAIYSKIALAANTEISGTVSLPEGVPASTSNQVFQVQLIKFANYSYVWCGQFTLPANETTATYQCTLDETAGDAGVALYASFGMDEVYGGWLYYNSTAVNRLWDYDRAEHLAAGNVHTGVNFPLLKAVTATGSLKTPNLEVFEKNESLNIYPYIQDTLNGSTNWKNIGGWSLILPAGSDHVDYSFQIPATTDPIRMGYSWNGSPQPLFVSEGYYHPDGTKYDIETAANLDASTDITNLNIPLLKGIPLNGTVHLPNGETNSQVMTVAVQVQSEDNSIYETQTVTIPAGGSSADFSFALPPNKQVNLSYYSISGADKTYLSRGYYSPSGTTPDYWPPSWVSTNPPTPLIDLTLLPGVLMSGTVSLPDGLTYPNDISGSISLELRTQYNYSDYYSEGFTIPAGQTSTPWSSLLPQSNQNIIIESYLDKYQYDPDPVYLQSAYYNSAGTVGLYENAEPVNASTDHNNINITLLKGNIVSGTIGLSPDVFPGSGDISIMAFLGNSNWTYFYTDVSFSSGQSSAAYSITIPPDAPNYRIYYYQWGAPSAYLDNGYYNTTQSGYCESDATILTSGMDHPNTDITLLKSYTLAGRVGLPNGTTEPVDIPISLGALYLPTSGQYATTLSGTYPQTVVLPKDTNSVQYELAMPPVCSQEPGNYLLGYNQDNSNYVHFGYYHPSGSVGLIAHSELLPPGQSYSGKNLDLIPGNPISGTISLPGGATAPTESLPVTLGTLQEPTSLYHTTVYIEPNTLSTPYTIRVAPDVGSVALGYVLPENPTYAAKGYYSYTATLPSKVTGRLDHATQFTTTAGNTDFALDYGNLVSGTIHLPEIAGHNVPIVVTLAADPADPSTIYGQKVINVDAGTQAAPYSQRIILDSNIVAQYTNSQERQWSPAGYYFDMSKSVPALAAATRLIAGTDHSFIDLLLLQSIAGDLNYDGVIDLKDVILGLQIMAGKTPSASITDRADVNGDGVIGMPEVLYLLNHQ